MSEPATIAHEPSAHSDGVAVPPLGDAQLRAFAARARQLGHDPGALRDGAEQIGYPVIASVAAARGTLSTATAAQRRRRRLRVFFNPVVAARKEIGQGIHDRLEAAIFAGGAIDGDDEARAARHFPFPVRTISVLRKRVGFAQCWDLSVRGERWGLDDRDDICTVANVGELILDPDATVIVRGNLLVLTVQRLVIDTRAASVPYQLAILPTPFSLDARTGPLHGLAGAPGSDGRDSADGRGARTQPTLLGPRLLEPAAAGAADGQDGEDGHDGSPGAGGRTGGASKLAEITIGELVGSLTLLAAGGNGGRGGRGGHGGRGGAGGSGAPAQRTLRESFAAGRGGNGGRGGDGGGGGRGGNGGICSNVFVSLPAHQADRVLILAHPALGGRAGEGGAGGLGGRGAAGGPDGGGAAGGDAGAGRDGADGACGRAARDGRSRPAPPVFVNDRAVEPVSLEHAPPAPDTLQSTETRRQAAPKRTTTRRQR